MMPRAVSPMLSSASGWVSSPWARILVVGGARPRSTSALPIAAGWPPPGTKM